MIGEERQVAHDLLSRAERATKALREPDASLWTVANTVRQSIADVIEELRAAAYSKSEWTCGHVAGAMCAECYRELAARAHELAEENLRLRGED